MQASETIGGATAPPSEPAEGRRFSDRTVPAASDNGDPPSELAEGRRFSDLAPFDELRVAREGDEPRQSLRRGVISPSTSRFAPGAGEVGRSEPAERRCFSEHGGWHRLSFRWNRHEPAERRCFSEASLRMTDAVAAGIHHQSRRSGEVSPR